MSQRQNYLAQGFQNVDSQSDVQKFKTCLTFIDSLPSFRKYKEETERLLRPADGRVFVDIGCGLGFDVERLATKTYATIIGLDASQEFLRDARQRAQDLGVANAEYVVANALQTCFEDGKADGARVDRTLQHLERPELAIEEMARIVRKGGRVVCAEPDWGSFFIDDDDADCFEEVYHQWTKSIRNPYIGRELPRMIKSAGLTDIKTSGYLLTTYGLHEVDMVFDLKKTSGILSERRDSDHFNNWYRKLVLRDAQLPVFAAVTIVIASGVKE